MNYDQSIQYLYGIRLFGSKLGLENTRWLLNELGNPHESLRFIHIAGTNGKGSAAAMLESVYRRAGWTTGMFTSPHLVSFRERFQIDRHWISEEEVAEGTSLIQERIQRTHPTNHPTFFEILTAMACLYFHRRRCGLILWETGMGGRLDATNVVTPEASVITNVGMDHTHWLGSTLAEIAGEKAGIIKPDVPAVTAAQAPEALRVLRMTAEKLQAPFHQIKPGDLEDEWLGGLRLAMQGRHQRWNAALCRKVVHVLQSQFPVEEEAMREGLESAWLDARFQILRLDGGARLVIDGAHNADSFEATVRSMRDHFPDQPWTLVLSVMEDKDWKTIADMAAQNAARVILLKTSSARSARPEQLRDEIQRIRPGMKCEIAKDASDAMNRRERDALTLVSGSFYLAGDVLAHLRDTKQLLVREQPLNEWNAANQRSGPASGFKNPI